MCGPSVLRTPKPRYLFSHSILTTFHFQRWGALKCIEATHLWLKGNWRWLDPISNVLHSLLPECFPLFKIIDPIQCSPGQALLWTRNCYHWLVWIFVANISCSLSSMQNRGLPGIPCGEVAWPRIGSHWIMTMIRRLKITVNSIEMMTTFITRNMLSSHPVK